MHAGESRHVHTAGRNQRKAADPAELLPHDPLEQGEGLRLVRLRREQVRPGLDPGDDQLEPGEDVAMRVQVALRGESLAGRR